MRWVIEWYCVLLGGINCKHFLIETESCGTTVESWGHGWLHQASPVSTHSCILQPGKKKLLWNIPTYHHILKICYTLQQATVTTDKYLYQAWDINNFPLNVADEETAAPKYEIVFQESSKSKFLDRSVVLHDICLRYSLNCYSDNLNLQYPVWFPIDLYAKGGNLIKFKFDGPLINSGAHVRTIV